MQVISKYKAFIKLLSKFNLWQINGAVIID